MYTLLKNVFYIVVHRAGIYYKFLKQKGEKNYYGKKYRFEPEPDLNRGSVQSLARCLNQTVGPVLSSAKMAKNWTELDFGNTNTAMYVWLYIWVCPVLAF